MDGSPTATGAAAAAAEAVRTLNHRTMRPLSPGTPGWEDLADLFAVVGELRALAQRLPQTPGQATRPLHRPEPATGYATDNVDADVVVGAGDAALAAAGLAARRLAADLARAHEGIAHRYVADELRLVDAAE